MASVLLVTDAGTWEQETRRHLIAEGFEVLEAIHINGFFEATSVDIAVIDLGLVGSVGVAACAAIRARGATPILALARTNDELVIIGALSAGADQYAARRISTRELVARIRALLRRFPPRQAPMAGVATAGHIAIDSGRSEATVAGHVIPLVGAELEILQILLARSGRLVTRAELSLGRWGAKDGYASIDLVVRRLRDKLEAVDDRRRITTIRGLGFRLDIADPAPPAGELGVVL